jgi:hypothetical protein
VNSARPELIFVRGPQQGERAVMMANAVLVGRSPSADVRLTEQATSREQVRFALSPEGWLMENLSTNGTRINGKNYKKKKKLILETGDILAVGLETEILYVAPGDDPEEAIAEYRQANAPKEAPAAKEAPAPAAPATAKPQAKPAPAKAPQAEIDQPAAGAGKAGKAGKDAKGPKDAKALQEAAEKDGEKEQIKGKKMKVALFAVMLTGMLGVGVVVALKSIWNDPGSGPPDMKRLTQAEIAEFLATPLPEKPPSPVKAAEALNRAVESFNKKNLWEVEKGDLFRCVRDFKLYLAYKNMAGFPVVRQERMFEQAQAELTKLVGKKYDEAWLFEKAHNWRQAKLAYDDLMLILPVGEVSKDDPRGAIKTKIIENVILHINVVKDNIGKVKEY